MLIDHGFVGALEALKVPLRLVSANPVTRAAAEIDADVRDRLMTEVRPLAADFLKGKVFVFGKARYPEGTGAGKSKKRAEPALLCFDVKTGELVKQEVFMEANGSLSAADGMLYCVEGAERYWKTPKISLVKPTPDGFEVTGSFTPITGTKEVYVNVTIAQGRMFHRHGRLLAVYDLRADDSQ